MNTVTTAGNKVRIEAPKGKYTLDLWQAQEFTSDIILALEKLNGIYVPPSTTTKERSLRISSRREIRVDMSGSSKPGLRLTHARVIVLDQDQAHQLVEMICSAIEQTEDYHESRSRDPYPS